MLYWNKGLQEYPLRIELATSVSLGYRVAFSKRRLR